MELFNWQAVKENDKRNRKFVQLKENLEWFQNKIRSQSRNFRRSSIITQDNTQGEDDGNIKAIETKLNLIQEKMNLIRETPYKPPAKRKTYSFQDQRTFTIIKNRNPNQKVANWIDYDRDKHKINTNFTDLNDNDGLSASESVKSNTENELNDLYNETVILQDKLHIKKNLDRYNYVKHAIQEITNKKLYSYQSEIKRKQKERPQTTSTNILKMALGKHLITQSSQQKKTQETTQSELINSQTQEFINSYQLPKQKISNKKKNRRIKSSYSFTL